MATTYQTKDVADRSGFSTAALRHYEEIGLLSPPDRTPSGYRTYVLFGARTSGSDA